MDLLAKQVKGQVGAIIDKKAEVPDSQKLVDALDLRHLLECQVSDLSGGELQRFPILVTFIAEWQRLHV